MKCSFCSNELEAGAQFCPHCGMILSLSDEEPAEVTTPAEQIVEEKSENVFNADSPINEEEFHVAMELEPNTTEEFVDVVEGIPEYVSAFPEPEVIAEAEEEAEVEPEVKEEVENVDVYSGTAEAESEPEKEVVPVEYNLEDDLDENAGVSHKPTTEEATTEFVINTPFDEEDEGADEYEEVDEEYDDDEYVNTRKIKNG